MRDLSEKLFGQLIVAEKVGDGKKGNIKWLCYCLCGKQTIVSGDSLLGNKTKSCGCLRREMLKQRNMKHGHSGGKNDSPSREYRSWQAMLSRCLNPNREKYKTYGARGITVCDRWRDFRNFLEDMGKRPLGTTLDRIKNNLGYFKENCQWATPLQQTHNRGGK